MVGEASRICPLLSGFVSTIALCSELNLVPDGSGELPIYFSLILGFSYFLILFVFNKQFCLYVLFYCQISEILFIRNW